MVAMESLLIMSDIDTKQGWDAMPVNMMNGFAKIMAVKINNRVNIMIRRHWWESYLRLIQKNVETS